MSSNLPGNATLAYTGLPEKNPPDIITTSRDPRTSDYRNVKIGDLWYNKVSAKFWMLVSLARNIAIWDPVAGPTPGDISFLTGNVGGAVTGDSVGNVNLLGAASQIVVTGNPGTNTLTLSLAGGGQAIDTLIPGSGIDVVPDASGNVHFPNGNGIATVGTTNTLTTNMNSPFTGDFEFIGGLTATAHVYVGDVSPVNPVAINLEKTVAGGVLELEIRNLSNAANSHAIIGIVTGQTGGASTSGDPFLTYNVADIQNWSHGIRNEDSQSFYLTSSNFLSSNIVLKATTAGIVSIPNTLNAGGGTAVTNGANVIPLQAVANLSGHAVQSYVVNNSNTASSDAGLVIQTGGTSAGDAYIFMTGVTTPWGVGVHQSDSSSFVITTTAGPTGGTERFKLSTTGAATFNAAFTFPTTDGTANQVLTTDGSGTVSWANAAGTARAFGTFAAVSSLGGVSLGNGYGVSSINCSSLGPPYKVYDVTLNGSVLNPGSDSTNTVVSVVTSDPSAVGFAGNLYVVNSATSVTFNVLSATSADTQINFSIFQS